MTKTIMALALSALSFFVPDSPSDVPPPLPSPIRASYYAHKFEGRRAADGSRYRAASMTGASRSFPLGSVVAVRSLDTGKEVRVTITDRGPWSRKFNLDLSERAFRQLGLTPRAGWGWVIARRVG